MIALFPSRTVAFILFYFPVHWYGLLYLLGFLIAWWLLPRLQRFRGLTLTHDEWSGILSAAVLGVLIGGRLGFVLLYQPDYYFRHLPEIFAVWQGGMSSHGGFIGVAIALLIVLRRRSWNEIFAIADVIVVPVAIGLGLGRIGNFINQELYGTVTTLPWGMHFLGAEGLRHPVQLYEMAGDWLNAAICFFCLLQSAKRFTAGQVFALFLTMYGVVRFLVEFVRAQDYPAIHLFFITLTVGQFYTIPLFLAGVTVWGWNGWQQKSRP